MDLSIDSLSGYLWLAGVVLALGVLACAFVAVLARRHYPMLSAAFRRVDAWLEARTPQAWRFTRRRFARDAWYGLTLTLAVVLAGGSVFVFAEVTDGWTDQAGLYRIDRAVHERIDGAVTADVQAFFGAVTHLGDFMVVAAFAGILVVVLVVRHRWWQLLALLLTLGVGEGTVWGMKYLYARDRPGQPLAESVGASFPSAHAFVAMAFYGFLIYLVWRSGLGRGMQIAVSAGLGALIVLVGLSRVVLNVHWVSDVLGGFAIGLGWLVTSLVLTRATQAYHARRRRAQPG